MLRPGVFSGWRINSMFADLLRWRLINDSSDRSYFIDTRLRRMRHRDLLTRWCSRYVYSDGVFTRIVCDN